MTIDKKHKIEPDKNTLNNHKSTKITHECTEHTCKGHPHLNKSHQTHTELPGDCTTQHTVVYPQTELKFIKNLNHSSSNNVQ